MADCTHGSGFVCGICDRPATGHIGVYTGPNVAPEHVEAPPRESGYDIAVETLKNLARYGSPDQVRLDAAYTLLQIGEG